MTHWPPGDGEMAGRIRAFDWSATPLGPIAGWPQALRVAARLLLNTRHPMFIWWGPELIQLYNDAYRDTMGPEKHPAALGARGRDTWAEIWDVVGPQIAQVMGGGPATWHEDQLVPVTRHGSREDVWWTYSFSPIDDEAAPNGVGGVLVICRDVTAERLARTAAVESETRYRAFVTASSDVVYRMSPDWSVMQRLDGADFLADTPEPRTRWLEAYIHPDDQPAVQATIRHAIATRSQFELEHRVRRRDGTLGWTLSRAVPILSGGGDIVEWLGTARDVTVRKEAEAALRESEARHRLLIESWAQAVWETDPAGSVVADSPSWRSYTGQTLGEWVGYGWLNAIHPDDRAYAERQWRDAIAAQGLVDAEFRLRAPGGAWRWTNLRAAPVLDAGGRIEKWAGMNIDIDARKRAEAALRESEARYRMLFESMDEAYAVVEVLKDHAGGWSDFRFVEVNPAFLEHTSMPWPVGKTATELLGTPNPRWTQLYGQALDEDVPIRLVEDEPMLGRIFDLNIFALDRERNRVAVLFTDVTKSKRAEHVLRESEERQAFLLKLSDALRPLSDPLVIQENACRILGEHLDVDWAQYTEVDLTKRLISTKRDFHRSGFPSHVGDYPLDHYPVHAEAWREGRSLAVNDVATDTLLSEGERVGMLTYGVRAALTMPLVKPDGLVIVMNVLSGTPRSWRTEDMVLLENTADRTWAAVERARAEAALQESEARFAQFAASSSDALWIRDAATLEMEYISPASYAVYGVPPSALQDGAQHWTALIVPEDRDVALASLEQAKAGEVRMCEFRIRRRSDGAVRWISNTNFPLRDAQGRVQRVGGIAQDVTGARLAAERQGVLVAELQHRTRNLIAVVRGIANDTMRETGPTEAFRSAFADRLSALSRVQGLLSRSEAEPITIRSLLRLELDALGAGAAGDRVIVEGPEVFLRPSSVQTLALALHELATNARKYGALSHEGGRLAVTWRKRSQAGERRLVIEWVEIGLEQAPDRPASEKGNGGYGRELIEQALPHALGARTSYALSASGVRCTIDLAVRPGKGGS